MGAHNLDTSLKVPLAESCNVLDKTNESDFGKFGWVMDPEGNKVELWQPPLGQWWSVPNYRHILKLRFDF